MFSYDEIFKDLLSAEDHSNTNTLETEECSVEQQKPTPSASLPDETIHLIVEADDDAQQISMVSGESETSHQEKEQHLKEMIEEALQAKLPRLMEYRDKGYNSPVLDKKAVAQLQEKLQPSQTQKRWQQSISFMLKSINRLCNKQESSTPECGAMIQQVNTAIKLVLTGLEAIDSTEKLDQLAWDEEVEAMAEMQRNRLVEAVLKVPHTEERPAWADNNVLFAQLNSSQIKQRVAGLLFSDSYQLTEEHKKFVKLKYSWLGESHLARRQLAGALERNIAELLTGARHAREYAMKRLLTSVQSNVVNTENAAQLMDYIAGFNRYAQYIHAIDTSTDSSRFQRNPLIKAVKKIEHDVSDENAIHCAMIQVADILGEMVAVLKTTLRQTQPSEACSYELTLRDTLEQLEPPSTLEELKNQVEDLAEKAKQLSPLLDIFKKKLKKTGSKAIHKVKQSVGAEAKKNHYAIHASALLLLDTIQQIEQRVASISPVAMELEEAVGQYNMLASHRAYQADIVPILGELLDREMKSEATRWQQVRERVEEKLQTLIAPVTQLLPGVEAHNPAYQLYNTWCRAVRTQPVIPEQQREVEHFDRCMVAVVNKLLTLAADVNSSILHLPEQRTNITAFTAEKVTAWRVQLQQLKSEVKERVTAVTGTTLNNFSRNGMLARGMAEWAENLRRDYLQDIRPEEKETASALFERMLMTVLQENRTHFAKETDAQADLFLQRFNLAFNHAVQGNTIYPPTPEEILARTRSVPDDIKRWAQSKVVSGSINALIRWGIKPITNLVWFPARITLRSARKGLTVYSQLRKMDRGVRLEQGPPTLTKKYFVGLEFSKLNTRLALSLVPLVGYGVAVTVTAQRIYKKEMGDTREIAKKLATEAVYELPWVGFDVAFRKIVSKYYQQAAEQSLQQTQQNETPTPYMDEMIKSVVIACNAREQTLLMAPRETQTPTNISDAILAGQVHHFSYELLNTPDIMRDDYNTYASDTAAQRKKLLPVSSVALKTPVASEELTEDDSVRMKRTHSKVPNKKNSSVDKLRANEIINYAFGQEDLVRFNKVLIYQRYDDSTQTEKNIAYIMHQYDELRKGPKTEAERKKWAGLRNRVPEMREQVGIKAQVALGSRNQIESAKKEAKLLSEYEIAKNSYASKKEEIELALQVEKIPEMRNQASKKDELEKLYYDSIEDTISEARRLGYELNTPSQLNTFIKDTVEKIEALERTEKTKENKQLRKLYVRLLYLVYRKEGLGYEESDADENFTDKDKKRMDYFIKFEKWVNVNNKHGDTDKAQNAATKKYLTTLAEKFPDSIKKKVNYLYQQYPDVNSNDALEILKIVFIGTIDDKDNNTNLRYIKNNLEFLRQMTLYGGNESFENIVSTLKGTIYDIPSKFSISEADFAKIYENIDGYDTGPYLDLDNKTTGVLSDNQIEEEIARRKTEIHKKLIEGLATLTDEQEKILNYSAYQLVLLNKYIALFNDEALIKIYTYKLKNDYTDIQFCNSLAEEMLSSQDGENSQLNRKVLAAIIYEKLKNKQIRTLNLASILYKTLSLVRKWEIKKPLINNFTITKKNIAAMTPPL